MIQSLFWSYGINLPKYFDVKSFFWRCGKIQLCSWVLDQDNSYAHHCMQPMMYRYPRSENCLFFDWSSAKSGQLLFENTDWPSKPMSILKKEQKQEQTIYYHCAPSLSRSYKSNLFISWNQKLLTYHVFVTMILLLGSLNKKSISIKIVKSL